MPTEVTGRADLPHNVLNVSIYQGQRGLLSLPQTSLTLGKSLHLSGRLSPGL